MITDSFDDKSNAIIEPQFSDDATAVDACIVTFSNIIEKFVLDNYNCERIGQLKFVTGDTPVYLLESGGKKICFLQNLCGSARLRRLYRGHVFRNKNR